MFLFLNVCVWYVAYFALDKDLSIYFLSVGQGDAIFIQAPNGVQILIDGGPNSAVLRELTKIMPIYDRHIDVVMMTHPDADHVGGLNDVLNRYKVDMVFEPGVFASTTAYTSFRKKTKTKLARRGDRIYLSDDIYLDILFPDRDTDGWETNTASIISRLVYKDSSVLLTGDAPAKIEKFLVKYDDLESDILKLGHHGSNTSSAEEFIAEVNPEYAIVSSGKDNRYKHPHPAVIERVSKCVKNILNTAEVGTIHFVLEKDKILLK